MTLEKKIGERIDFLSDHWTMDDKKPFSFGGWRGEVITELMQLFQTYQAEDRERIARALEKKLEQASRSNKLYFDKHGEGNPFELGQLVVLRQAIIIVQGTEEEGNT